jgi:hypothetical protein
MAVGTSARNVRLGRKVRGHDRTRGSLFKQQDWGALGSNDGTGLVVGGQRGCNYQLSTWVFGIQGDAA